MLGAFEVQSFYYSIGFGLGLFATLRVSGAFWETTPSISSPHYYFTLYLLFSSHISSKLKSPSMREARNLLPLTSKQEKASRDCRDELTNGVPLQAGLSRSEAETNKRLPAVFSENMDKTPDIAFLPQATPTTVSLLMARSMRIHRLLSHPYEARAFPAIWLPFGVCGESTEIHCVEKTSLTILLGSEPEETSERKRKWARRGPEMHSHLDSQAPAAAPTHVQD